MLVNNSASDKMRIHNNLKQLNECNDLENNTIKDNKNSLDKKYETNSNIFYIIAYVCLWYSTAVFCITTSKKILLIFPFPIALCVSQFSLATIITFLIKKKYDCPPQDNFWYIIWKISISYTFGFIFTNIAFNLVNASFVETIKASEPISTVIFGYIIIKERNSLTTYSTLIPICIGVGISCIGELYFSMYGFIFALLSNICFSTRAVYGRQLFIEYPSSIDEINLFYSISSIGLLILVPLVVVTEGSQIYHYFINTSTEFIHLVQLVVVNGVAYTIYNIASFIVLSKVLVVTHAVLNVFRRVAIISATSYYFSISLTMLNIYGVVLAIAGVISFVLSKHSIDRSKPRV
jgi:solute carrier family 35 protein E1